MSPLKVRMLRPTHHPRRGLRSWWREHVVKPLDAMYEQLDEHQQDDDGQQR